MLHPSAPLLLNGMNVRWELRLVDDVAYLQVNALSCTCAGNPPAYPLVKEPFSAPFMD